MPAATCKSKRRALKFPVALILQIPFALACPRRSRCSVLARPRNARQRVEIAGYPSGYAVIATPRSERGRQTTRGTLLNTCNCCFLINAPHLFRGSLRISARSRLERKNATEGLHDVSGGRECETSCTRNRESLEKLRNCKWSKAENVELWEGFVV